MSITSLLSICLDIQVKILTHKEDMHKKVFQSLDHVYLFIYLFIKNNLL